MGNMRGAGSFYNWMLGDWRSIGFVAVSTVFIYITVLLLHRSSRRRAFGSLAVFDIIMAAASGTIVGRTATTASPSYAQSFAALVTLAAVHEAVGYLRLRFHTGAHDEPITLMSDGVVDQDALQTNLLTAADLYAAIRQRGIKRIDEVDTVLLEHTGRLSITKKAHA